MIILVIPDFAERRRRESFQAFARIVHDLTPNGCSIDLRARERSTRRGLCGEHGRVLPTNQDLCPICAGYLDHNVN